MLKKTLSFLLNFVLRLFPIDNNKIVFQATKYKVTDNPYFVYKYIKENNLNYRTVFIVAKDADVSLLQKGDYAYVRSLKSFYHLATYKYLFTCQSLGSIVKKRKNQVYIQLWHSISLKKMGLDVSNEGNLSHLAHTNDWDYVVSSSEFESRVLKSSSGYNCETKILGNPRTDLLFADFNIDAIKSRLGITNNKKIILYAPTFRDWELKKQNIDINLPKNITKNYNVLLRLHPLMAERVNGHSIDSNIIDACSYADLNELLAISDILITDYSSICFDFSLLKKPTVFYAYDYERYVLERGGFYIDYEKGLPGPVAYNEFELEAILNDTESLFKEYLHKINIFNQKYSTMNDGNSTHRIITELLNGGFEK